MSVQPQPIKSEIGERMENEKLIQRAVMILANLGPLMPHRDKLLMLANQSIEDYSESVDVFSDKSTDISNLPEEIREHILLARRKQMKVLVELMDVLRDSILDLNMLFIKHGLNFKK